MTLGLVVQSGSNRIIGHQQLAMEAEGFLSDVRDEIRQGSDFRLSSQHWLEFDLPSGETVRYRLDQRRIIRSLRAADGTQFQGTTILLHDVYYFACVPDEEGVEMEVGLQNWHTDLSVKTYIRGRVDKERAADRGGRR